MAAPIVSWWTQDNTAQVLEWNVGTIDAGTISPDFSVLVWNNRAGVDPVSPMESCTLTTKDNAGGNTGELVENTWVEVRVDSRAEASFTAIGGVTTHPVGAGGAQGGPSIIQGFVNDGSKVGAGESNFAEVTLHVNIPSLATAGTVDFLTRVSYTYV
jgi:hypothetical protein